MKFEVKIGSGKISVENDELHEVLIDAWARQLLHAWKAMADSSTPLQGQTKFVVGQKLAYYPTYAAKPVGKRDLVGIRTYISQKLAPFQQDWNDRKAILKTIRERFSK